jgi:N-acetylglucosaminyl-diphospho-decaprenol L-rhamnosyltransferase
VAEPRWAAVVVDYESGPLLDRCVRSLLADRSAGRPDVVVVDNAAAGRAEAERGASVDGVPVLGAPGNVGYARAANLGIAATRAPIVAVLNPDTEIAPGTGAAMLARFDADAVLGALGPRICNPDGSQYPSARSQPSTLDAAGHGALGWLWPANPCTRRYRQLDADPDVARPVDWVSGAAVWLRRAALDSIGGWDERYFLYMEDVDLCWRLRAAGWGVAYEPGGLVVHVQGASASRHPYRMLVEHHRSAWRFARRRLSGPRRVLVPAAGAYLLLRAGVALAVHASEAALGRGGRPASLPPREQGEQAEARRRRIRRAAPGRWPGLVPADGGRVRPRDPRRRVQPERLERPGRPGDR